MKEEEISKELRDYFARAEKEILDAQKRPDEFTRQMFQDSLGISKESARYELGKRLERGELTARSGYDEAGKPCLLYKIVDMSRPVHHRQLETASE